MKMKKADFAAAAALEARLLADLASRAFPGGTVAALAAHYGVQPHICARAASGVRLPVAVYPEPGPGGAEVVYAPVA